MSKIASATKKQSGFRRAFEFGCIAAREGLSVEDCPYDDRRKPDGRLTWSRAWRRAWIDGFEHATALIEAKADASPTDG